MQRQLDETVIQPHILWIEWPKYYIPGNPDQPTVSVRDGVVLESCPRAIAKGVLPGTPIRQAKALFHALQIQEWKAEAYESATSGWLDTCLDFVDELEVVDQHRCAIDLSKHTNIVEIAKLLTSRLEKHFEQPCLWSLAPARWIASIACSAGDQIVATPGQYLSTLPTERLLPIDTVFRERLRFLGYRTIGSVARLPYSVLRRQFGKSGRYIRSVANGEWADPVVPNYPQGSLTETQHFEPPIHSLIELDRVIDRFALRLGRRLADRQTTTIEVETIDEQDVRQRYARSFSKVIDDATSIRFAASLILDRRTIERPIASIKVRLNNLVPVRSQQGSLLTSDRRTHADHAIEKLNQKFGHESVQYCSQIVRSRRERVLSAWREAVGWD